MKRDHHSAHRPLADINIAPLVDVLLVLLVVLMLAMPMFVKRLPVELPQTSLTGTPTPIKALTVSLLADGTLKLGDSPVQLEVALAKVTSTVSVEISADKDVTYDVLAKTVSQFQARGPQDIVLLTR